MILFLKKIMNCCNYKLHPLYAKKSMNKNGKNGLSNNEDSEDYTVSTPRSSSSDQPVLERKEDILHEAEGGITEKEQKIRNILRYEIEPSKIRHFNTFYLHDVSSKLHGSSVIQFEINTNTFKAVHELFINSNTQNNKFAYPFVRIFTGDTDLDNKQIASFVCSCKSQSNEYRGIGQCSCSKNQIKPIIMQKGCGTDRYLEIYLDGLLNDTIFNEQTIKIKIRLDYLMRGLRTVRLKSMKKIEKIDPSPENKKQKIEKINKENIRHFELIFENSDPKHTFFPHFRKPAYYVLKYILPGSLNVISSLTHVTSMNYTKTHKVFIYSTSSNNSECLNYSVTATKISFIIGTFQKHALQLDTSIGFMNQTTKKNAKQTSMFKDLQDAERSSGNNFYIHVPDFLCKSNNKNPGFTKKYKHLITELISDIGTSIKYMKYLFSVNLFELPTGNKIDMNLVHTLSEIEISSSFGISMISMSNIYKQKDHNGVIKYKDLVLKVLSSQIFPVRHSSFDYNRTFDAYSGLFSFPALISRIVNIKDSDLNYLNTLSTLIEYITVFVEQKNSIRELWLQKGLQNYLFNKLRSEIHGRSFLESIKQININALEMFDFLESPLQAPIIDPEILKENLVRMSPMILRNDPDLKKIFQTLQNTNLNVFDTSNLSEINDSNELCLYSIINKNKSYRNTKLSKISEIKAEVLIHVIEASIGINIFRESISPLLRTSTINTDTFFKSLEDTTMKNYDIFRNQYLEKSGIVSLNILLKVDTKKSQINVFTEQIPPLLNHENVCRRYYGVIPIESREVENSHSHVFELLNDYRTFHNSNSFTSFYFPLSLFDVQNIEKGIRSQISVNRKPRTNIQEPDYRFTYYARSKKAKITEGLSFLYLQPDANFQILAKIRVLCKYAVKEKLEDRSVRTQLDGIESVERMLLESLFFLYKSDPKIDNTDQNMKNEQKNMESTNKIVELEKQTIIEPNDLLNDPENTVKEPENIVNNSENIVNNSENIMNNSENIVNNTQNTSTIKENESNSDSDSFMDINSEQPTKLTKQEQADIQTRRAEFKKRFLSKNRACEFHYPEQVMLHIDVLHKRLFDENTNIFVKFNIIEFLSKYDYQKCISFFIRYFCVENSTIIKPILDISSSNTNNIGNNGVEDLHLLENLLRNIGTVNRKHSNSTVFQLLEINDVFSVEYKQKRSMVIIDLYISILRYIDSSDSNTNSISNGDAVVSACVDGIMQHEILLRHYDTNSKDINNISSETRAVLHNIFIYEFINQSIRNQVFVSSLNYILYRFIRGEVSINVDYLIKLTMDGNYVDVRKVAMDGLLLCCFETESVDHNKARRYLSYFLNNSGDLLVIHSLERIVGLSKYKNKKCKFFETCTEIVELRNKIGARSSKIYELLTQIINVQNNEEINTKMKQTEASNLKLKTFDDFVVNIKVAQPFPEKLVLPLEITGQILEMNNPRLYKPVNHEAEDDITNLSRGGSISRSRSKSRSRSRSRKTLNEETHSGSLFSDEEHEGSLEEADDTPKKKIKMTVIPSESNEDSREYVDVHDIVEKKAGPEIITNLENRDWPCFKYRLYDWRCKVKKIVHIGTVGEVCLKVQSDDLKVLDTDVLSPLVE